MSQKPLYNPDGAFGIFDTKNQCWMGNSEGPLRYDSELIARLAARIMDVQLKQPAGQLRAMPVAGKNFKLLSEHKVLRPPRRPSLFSKPDEPSNQEPDHGLVLGDEPAPEMVPSDQCHLGVCRPPLSAGVLRPPADMPADAGGA